MGKLSDGVMALPLFFRPTLALKLGWDMFYHHQICTSVSDTNFLQSSKLCTGLVRIVYGTTRENCMFGIKKQNSMLLKFVSNAYARTVDLVSAEQSKYSLPTGHPVCSLPLFTMPTNSSNINRQRSRSVFQRPFVAFRMTVVQ